VAMLRSGRIYDNTALHSDDIRSSCLPFALKNKNIETSS
jgi:hypothetical protein